MRKQSLYVDIHIRNVILHVTRFNFIQFFVFGKKIVHFFEMKNKKLKKILNCVLINDCLGSHIVLSLTIQFVLTSDHLIHWKTASIGSCQFMSFGGENKLKEYIAMAPACTCVNS